MTRGFAPEHDPDYGSHPILLEVPGPVPTALDNDADTVELNITGDCVVCGRAPDECTCTDDEGA